jgi:hypothetical protein
MSRARIVHGIKAGEAPPSAQQAMLNTLNAWRSQLTYVQAARLQAAIMQHTMPTPGWPIERVIMADAEERN